MTKLSHSLGATTRRWRLGIDGHAGSFGAGDSFHFTFFCASKQMTSLTQVQHHEGKKHIALQLFSICESRGLVSDGCARSSQSPSVTERLEALRKSSDGSEGGVVGRGRRSYRWSNTWRTRFCVTWLRKIGGLRFWQVLFNATQLGGFTYYKTVRVLSIYWTYIDLSLYTEITQVKTYSLLWMMWPSWCRFSLGPVSTHSQPLPRSGLSDHMPTISGLAQVFVTRCPCVHPADGLRLPVLTQRPSGMSQQHWQGADCLGTICLVAFLVLASSFRPHWNGTLTHQLQGNVLSKCHSKQHLWSLWTQLKQNQVRQRECDCNGACNGLLTHES